MDDFMKNLSSMLNGKEIPDNIKGMLSSIMNNSNNGNNSNNSNSSNFSNSSDNADGLNNSNSCNNSINFRSPDNTNDYNSYENSNRSDAFSGSSTNSNSDFPNIDINTILKMQQIMKSMNSEQSNSRTNLLRSLKPYLKPSRQEKVDQYIQLFNMEKVIELLNNNGGGKK